MLKERQNKYWERQEQNKKEDQERNASSHRKILQNIRKKWLIMTNKQNFIAIKKLK